MGNGEPTLRVERGQASAAELAVLTVVLLALRGGREQPERALGSDWWRRPDTYKAPCSWQRRGSSGAEQRPEW
ncbi:acyl-CoA carboxylase subunit epsilon [Streptomyces sp. ALI-76-A]|jgi:hypothetical protein|uniref:acyl-CoA carboxylase subunit epsilon n=1 Tax=Streptomyces sp. ALI-76-A TaxID=3025736 RepID=UPI00256EF8FC|nr:acyl-CoA carboxylase subunit epsilon [Streptomyces sp. ALI-76-A]MDL5205379.1 acyl-CoA carboxylase subunit epsilon [Streptomyces sp. ALI-76-A]